MSSNFNTGSTAASASHDVTHVKYSRQYLPRRQPCIHINSFVQQTPESDRISKASPLQYMCRSLEWIYNTVLHFKSAKLVFLARYSTVPV